MIVGGCHARYGRDELIKAFPPPVRHKPDPSAPRPKFNGHAPPGLERFIAPLKSIPAENYGTCIKVGQALAYESGRSTEGLAQWDAWCGTSVDKWSPDWCAAKWRSFNGSGVTGGSIFALAEQHGYVKPAKPSKERPKATHHLNGSAQPPHKESVQPRTNGKGNRVDGLEFDDEQALVALVSDDRC